MNIPHERSAEHTGRIENRLMALGLTLPAPSAPAFQYVPVVIHRDVAYVSGQLPRMGGGVVRAGKSGWRYRSSTPRTPHASVSFRALLVSSRRLEASIRSSGY